MIEHLSPGPFHFYVNPQPNGCPIIGDSNRCMVAMLAHSVKDPRQEMRALANAALLTKSRELLDIALRLQAWDKKWPKYHDRSGESEKEMNQICLDAAAIVENIEKPPF